MRLRGCASSFMRKFQILRCCGQFRLICLLVNTIIENKETQTTELNIDQNFISLNGGIAWVY